MRALDYSEDAPTGPGFAAKLKSPVRRPVRYFGAPHIEHVSTSYVERSNLTLRMSQRRFTRLTNAFSKKVENLEHAVALFTTHYNFCRVHKTLRVTPAMEAGLADHVWTLDELVGLVPEPKRAAWGTKNGRASEPNSN